MASVGEYSGGLKEVMTRIPGYQRHLYPAGWNAISKRIKAKDGFHCKGCGIPTGHAQFYLTTHHIDGNPQNCADDNLITLCTRCHDLVSGMIPRPLTRLEVIQRLKRPEKQHYLRF